ncbi:hypothetical protein [Acinetobacter seifertii]|uniref:hypothetical protein n=1 Tax=Acinetobacter seifertii TaxID=1530123 RepID=UPI000C1EEADA|nr:hypothetical protein [Acinetobacter seifertii]PJF05135.1 hypothetical protein CVD06_03295 [Acinetobacter seifertii]PJG69295.1 hypothetical protein CVD08_15580 [Acinetobacter seifertii]
MAYVCSELQLINNVQTCVSWVEQVTLLEQLAITKAQMVMLGTPIVGIYGLIIAFSIFNNFAKRA